MADSFQSLIEGAAGTQSLAQANTPSWVNNGNPNTVYNQTPAEGGYTPPRSDVLDNWQINKPRVYAPTDWDALTSQVEKTLIKPNWNLNNSAGSGVGQPLPPQAQPGAPQQPSQPQQPAASQFVPVNQWFGSGQKDGGRSGPLSNQDLVNGNPAAKWAWDTVFALHKGKFDKTSDWAAVQRDLNSFYQDAINAGIPTSGAGYNQQQAAMGSQVASSPGGTWTKGPQPQAQGGGGGAAGPGGGAGQSVKNGGRDILGFGASGGSGLQSSGNVQAPAGGNWNFGGGGANYGGASTLYNLSPTIATKLGIQPNGSIAWQQIADFVLPGNAYLSNTGQWDVSNVVTSLLGEITGLPIDSILTKLGEVQAGQDDPQNFIERALIDHYLDKAQNELAGKLNITQAEFQKTIAPLLSQTIADNVNIASVATQNKAVQDLLAKAEAKLQQKMNQPSGGGGGGGGSQSGHAANGYYGGNVTVSYGSGGGGRGGGGGIDYNNLYGNVGGTTKVN